MALSFHVAPERYNTEELSSSVKKFLVRSNTADVIQIAPSCITHAATRYLELPIMKKTEFDREMKTRNGKLDEMILNHPDLLLCVDIAKVEGRYELFLRVQTPADAGGTAEERANDSVHLWKLNYKALKAVAAAFGTEVYDKSSLSEDEINRLSLYLEMVTSAPEKTEPQSAPFRIDVSQNDECEYPSGMAVVPDCNLKGVALSAKNMKRRTDELKAVEESEQRSKQARLELADRMVTVTPLPNGQYVVVSKVRDQVVTTDSEGNTVIIGSAPALP